MAAKSLAFPVVISIKRAKKPRHGIELFADVRSRSRSTRLVHNVVASKRGDLLRFNCSCESRLFRPRTKCIHIQSVTAKLGGAR
jgi:hypothetical protein